MAANNFAWLKGYDDQEALNFVCDKMNFSENEAKLRIHEIECKLVLLNSPNGKQRLESSKSEKMSQLEHLSQVYRRQDHKRCCGVASMAIGLDYFRCLENDENNFTSEPEMFELVKTLDESLVKQRGMTLDTLTKSCQELFTEPKFQVIQFQPNSIEDLEKMFLEHFEKNSGSKKVLICNYNMKLAGQGDWLGGHISPVAAFDKTTNSALILDVWKYTDPFWIRLETLLNSLSIDPDSNKSRGFVQINS